MITPTPARERAPRPHGNRDMTAHRQQGGAQDAYSLRRALCELTPNIS